MSYFAHSLKTYDVILMIIFAAGLVAAAIFAQSFRKKQYDIIGKRKIFFTVSAVLLAISLLSLIIHGFGIGGGKLNYSLEFTGGTILELGFEKPDINADDITKVINAYNETIPDRDNKLKHPFVQMEGKSKEIELGGKTREVTLTLKKKNGGSLTAQEVNGILTPLCESFGKVVFLNSESSKMEGQEVTVKLGFSKTDIKLSAEPGEGSDTAGKAETDRDKIIKSLGFYDPDMEVADIKLGDTVDLPASKKEYKAAILRITKENLSNLSTDDVIKLNSQFAKMFCNVYKFKIESIGPTIGVELRNKAILAIFIALGLQLIYITLRFGNQVRFGLAADIALFHDLILMTGIYAIVGREFDSPFVCALLTVIGYSVMDSIVIFDRIRENLKIFKKETYEEAVNISVNQTMSRSVNTLLTVLLTLFALFFFGGATLKNFAFALLIGCTTGAYSSIFIASPILVLIDKFVKKKEAERVAVRRAELADAAAKRSEKVKAERKETAADSVDETEEGEEQSGAVEDKIRERHEKRGRSKQRKRVKK